MTRPSSTGYSTALALPLLLLTGGIAALSVIAFCLDTSAAYLFWAVFTPDEAPAPRIQVSVVGALAFGIGLATLLLSWGLYKVATNRCSLRFIRGVWMGSMVLYGLLALKLQGTVELKGLVTINIPLALISAGIAVASGRLALAHHRRLMPPAGAPPLPGSRGS